MTRRAFAAPVLAGATVLAAAGAAWAQSRPSLETMTCAEAAALLDQKSAVVFTTGENTYARFFASRVLCSMQNLDAAEQSVRTADSAACRIGYICRQRTDD